jgi:hypothetical protein
VSVVDHGDLGLRSLAPAALFGARLTSFFETRRRLPTSATAYDVRARTSSSRDPRRDGRRDALPFLTPHASPLAGTVRRGETRKVRSRRPRCRLCLAFTRRSRPRYRLERATSERVAPPDSLVANDLHGSEDRAKDVSSAGREHAVRHLASGAYASKRACGQRSLPRRPTGRPMSSVGRPTGEEPTENRRTDQGQRSGTAPRRTAPSRRPGRLSPSRTRGRTR